MNKKATYPILVALILGCLARAAVSVYCIFDPPQYALSGFDTSSPWSWAIAASQALVVISLLVVAFRVEDKYSRAFWLFMAAVFLSGVAKRYLLAGAGAWSHVITVLASFAIIFILLVCLLQYRKHRFTVY